MRGHLRTLRDMVLDTAAFSLDGRTFRFRVGRGAPVVAGDLVTLRRLDGSVALGQVRAKSLDGDGATGEGALLDPGATGPFDDAAMTLAAPKDWAQLAPKRPLEVGTLPATAGEVPALLRADAFNRHTFLCGQSGSGKTYSLGVLLERILAYTSLPMVIVDPNADFVRLRDLRDGASGDLADRLREVGAGVRVLRPGGDDPLRVRFFGLPPMTKGAVFGLDPVADRDEFNALLHVANLPAASVEDVPEALRASGDVHLSSIAARVENLSVHRWDVWARGGPGVLDDLPGESRATILDLAGFARPLERSLVATAVLDHLWERREERSPILVVIDEAHNICSANPTDPLQALATERLIQIAGEGRKYGIWLLLSTQRPSKIHPQVLTQCDNLMLMRMNSPGDVAELAEIFGFVPRAMLDQAPFFRQGEALLAGGFAPVPMIARIGARLTHEGGIDVPVPA